MLVRHLGAIFNRIIHPHLNFFFFYKIYQSQFLIKIKQIEVDLIIFVHHLLFNH